MLTGEQLEQVPCSPDPPAPPDGADSTKSDHAVVLTDDLTQSEKAAAELHH
jgi:hypothetical protein